MSEYTFFGTIHPERTVVSLGPLENEFSFGSPAVNGMVWYHVSLSQVTAKLKTDASFEDVYTARNIVEGMIRIGLDSLGFTLGCGFDLEIIQAIGPHLKKSVVFGVGVDALKSLASNDGIEFRSLLDRSSGSEGRYFHRALSDLREAIRTPSDTAFLCFRAIESLRQFFLNCRGAKDGKQSWEHLRESLGTTRDELEFIKGRADPIRHGDVGTISSEDRVSILRRTWGILCTFTKHEQPAFELQPAIKDIPPEDAANLTIDFVGCISRSQSSPHIAIRHGGERFLSITRTTQHVARLFMKCYREDGRLLFEVIGNRLHLNSKTATVVSKSTNAITVNSEDGCLVELSYIHPLRFRISGRYFLRNGLPLIAQVDSLSVGTIKLANCSVGTLNI